MKLKNQIFTFLLTLLIPLNLWAQEVRFITTEGVAAIMQDDKALARDRAIEDALRKAVEQAVGTVIEADTLVSNFQVLNDSIYSQSRGYVQTYKVLQENVGEVYRVKLEAVISMDNLQNDLAALGTLLQRMHRPRLVVAIELSAPGWGRSAELNPAEVAIIEAFRNKGFDLVDRMAVAPPGGQEVTIGQDYIAIFSSDQSAAAWALEKGAEVIITGRAVVRKATLPMLGAMNSYQANLTLSAIRTSTGEILATGSEQDVAVHIDDVTGAKQAIEKASRKLGEQMVSSLSGKFSQEVSGSTTIQMIILGINDQQLVELKNVLGQQVRGIQPGGIHQRSFADRVASLDIQIQGNAQALADELTQKTFANFKLSMVKFSSHKLELQFIPKGSLPEIR